MMVVLCHLITPSMSYDSALDGLKWPHQLSPSIKGPSDEQYLQCKQSLSISGKQTETITCHFYYMTFTSGSRVSFSIFAHCTFRF